MISRRLSTIIDMVSDGRRSIADIGCDHAIVSIELAKKYPDTHIIAMDVAEGPLQIARENIVAAGFGDRIETRLSDGFEKLGKGETDTAIIAGMGGMLVTSILSRGKSTFDKGYELILSPQSDMQHFRTFLRTNNIYIKKEAMLYEDGKYYVIVKCTYDPDVAETSEVSADSRDERLTQAAFDCYGRYLLEHKDEVCRIYILGEIEKINSVLCKLNRTDSDAARNRSLELNSELDIAVKALDIMEKGYGKG